MTRRDAIKALIAAIAAAQLPAIPEAALDAAMPADWSQPFDLDFDLKEYRIVFPDGTMWTFKGFVQAVLMDPLNDKFELSIRPTGEATKTFAPPDLLVPELTHPNAALTAHGTTMQIEGRQGVVSLDSITPPTVSRNVIDVSTFNNPDQYVQGLKRYGDIKMTGKWRPQ